MKIQCRSQHAWPLSLCLTVLISALQPRFIVLCDDTRRESYHTTSAQISRETLANAVLARSQSRPHHPQVMSGVT